MTVPPIDISSVDWDLLRALLHHHLPNREIWAFGSRARRNSKQFSDLDIAVIGETALSLDQTAALREALCESDLPFRVDIVDWARTDAAFRKIIESDKVPLQSATPTHPPYTCSGPGNARARTSAA